MVRVEGFLVIVLSMLLLSGCGSSEVERAYDLVQEKVYEDIGPDATLPCCAEDYFDPGGAIAEDELYFFIPMEYKGVPFIVQAFVYSNLDGETRIRLIYRDSNGQNSSQPPLP